jgi:nucleotide-binding universal stress UspA family protein
VFWREFHSASPFGHPAAPVPLITLVAEGDPAASLIKASEEADLLVLGTRGRSPWAGLLLGSVSQRCAAGTACPVVLIKLPGERASDDAPA